MEASQLQLADSDLSDSRYLCLHEYLCHSSNRPLERTGHLRASTGGPSSLPATQEQR